MCPLVYVWIQHNASTSRTRRCSLSSRRVGTWVDFFVPICCFSVVCSFGVVSPTVQSAPIKVFELDGLKSGPILLGDIPPTSDGETHHGEWLRIVSPAIEKRITRYASGEIRFNLMAIVKNRRCARFIVRQVYIRQCTLDRCLFLLYQQYVKVYPTMRPSIDNEYLWYQLQ